jgi:hypothetical protein
MRVRRLDHVLLAMPSGRESEARNFYQGILGIPEATKPSDLAGRGGCWFEDGDLKVHLGVEKNFVPAKKVPPGFHRRRPRRTDLGAHSGQLPDLA